MAKRKTISQVEADAAAADRAGISYGEYKARQYDVILKLKREAAERERIKREEERRDSEEIESSD